MTAAERIELRKKLTGLGRHELIRLLLEAWAEADAREPQMVAAEPPGGNDEPLV